MAGRKGSFSEEEIEVLRAIARKLMQDRDWSGTQLGDAIGIAQQNASRFVKPKSMAGMDRGTANKLAIVAGYRNVEHALLEAGVLAEMQPLPADRGLWTDRDVAMKIAKRMGYPDEVINAVAHRHREHFYSGKGLRWWNDKIVLEALARKDDSPDPQAPPASTSTITVTEVTPPKPEQQPNPKRKRSGTGG